MQNNKLARMVLRALKLFELILPAILWMLLLFGFDSPPLAISTLIAAALHELGHISYLIFHGNGISLFAARANGLRLYPLRTLSYREEAAFAAAGPFANLIFAIIFFLISKVFGEYFLLLSVINVMTMLSNLLPIEGQDGYNLLLAIFAEKYDSAERILRRISFFFSATLSFLALYLIEKLDTGYWIFALFSIYAYTFIKKSQKMAFFENS
jgi:Zn-dependent protease